VASISYPLYIFIVILDLFFYFLIKLFGVG